MADSGITAIISQKLYPEILPQNVQLPAAVMCVENSEPYGDISGNAGLFRTAIRVDCWSKQLADAIALGDLIRLSLQGYSGEVSGVKIWGIVLSSLKNNYVPEVSNYQRNLFFLVWHDEENPDHD